MREKLLEIVEQQRALVGQHGERRIVAHRAYGFAAGVRHRLHNHPQVFQRVAECDLLREQIAIRIRRRRVRGGQVVQRKAVGGEPLAIRLTRGEIALELSIVHQPALRAVQHKHPPRMDALLEQDALRRYVQHARFRRHHKQVVGCDQVAAGAQPVAVKHGAHPRAVSADYERRPIPRLHQSRVVFVEIALSRIHRQMIAPRLRYHHHQGMRQRAAGCEQQLQRVVKACGIALYALADDGQQFRHIIAQRVGREHPLARGHPIDVAAHGVYLAIVYHMPVRMRQLPCAERVRAEPRVNYRE